MHKPQIGMNGSNILASSHTLRTCDETLLFLVWYHIFFTYFNLRFTLFLKKKCTFRTINIVRNVIRPALKNEYWNSIKIIRILIRSCACDKTNITNLNWKVVNFCDTNPNLYLCSWKKSYYQRANNRSTTIAKL